jgi:hypothetical protein
MPISMISPSDIAARLSADGLTIVQIYPGNKVIKVSDASGNIRMVQARHYLGDSEIFVAKPVFTAPAGGERTIAVAAPYTLGILNDGNASLTLGDPIVSGLVNAAVTVQTVTPAVLAGIAPGASGSVVFQVTPTAVGPWSFKIGFAAASVTVDVSGTAIE